MVHGGPLFTPPRCRSSPPSSYNCIFFSKQSLATNVSDCIYPMCITRHTSVELQPP